MNVDQLIAKLTELRSRVGGDTPVELGNDYLMISEVSVTHTRVPPVIVIYP